MSRDPLLTTLLDLDAALASRELIVGGGYGLYLKQLHLSRHPGTRTLLPLSALPSARTTQDIDLILRAEVVTDSTAMKQIRAVLDSLRFRVVERARYMQFVRDAEPGEVKIDLLAAPLGPFADRVPNDPRRVKPRPRVELHASKLEEALGVDSNPLRLEIEGTLTTGERHQTTILVPQAFSYLLMKLHAFRDRSLDADRELGRHHALDVYRIVGMVTDDEYPLVRRLVHEFSDEPAFAEARRIAMNDFVDPNGVGQTRIREHALYHDDCDLLQFAAELEELLSVQDSPDR